jgi:hypothetical protein
MGAMRARALALLVALLYVRHTHQQACTGLFIQNLPFTSGMAAAKAWRFTDTATLTRQVGAPGRMDSPCVGGGPPR